MPEPQPVDLKMLERTARMQVKKWSNYIATADVLALIEAHRIAREALNYIEKSPREPSAQGFVVNECREKARDALRAMDALVKAPRA